MKSRGALIVELAQVYAIAQRVPTDELVIQLSHMASMKTRHILGIFEEEWKGISRNEINPYRKTLRIGKDGKPK